MNEPTGTTNLTGASYPFETIEAAPEKAATSLQGLTKSTPANANEQGASMATPKPKPDLRPDDPRHGSWAGYVRGCRLECCRTAAALYQKTRIHDARNGRRRTVPARGTRRRLEALVALGWSFRDISNRAGVVLQTVHRWHDSERVYKRTARTVAAVYDELSMTLPPQETAAQRNTVSRMHTLAKRRGFLPPLAWDDIDNDPAPSTSTVEPLLVDDVKVQRVLDGWLEDCNDAERFAVIERWDGTLAELQRVTGWNIYRITKIKKAA